MTCYFGLYCLPTTYPSCACVCWASTVILVHQIKFRPIFVFEIAVDGGKQLDVYIYVFVCIYSFIFWLATSLKLCMTQSSTVIYLSPWHLDPWFLSQLPFFCWLCYLGTLVLVDMCWIVIFAYLLWQCNSGCTQQSTNG